MIKDAQEKEVKVGDKVAFGQAGRGAQELEIGVVSKLTEKGVKIEQPYYNKWNDTNTVKEHYRIAKAFVVLGE